MKPTKARLRDHVSRLEGQVVASINKKKSKAIRKQTLAWWESHDKDFKKLNLYFKTHQEKKDAKNCLLDFLSENNLMAYGFYRDNNHYDDFEAFKTEFFNQLKECEVKGVQKIEVGFDTEIVEVRKSYRAVRSNLDKLSAKKGLVYLEELGLDVSVFETEDVQLPMIVVDKAKLRIPAKEVDVQ